MKRKILAVVLSLAMVVSVMQTQGGKTNSVYGAESLDVVAHAIPAGTSKEANPLKGMIGYNFSSPSFPHSMEWFYIPVNDVQKGMNEFDWTKLENELNKVAKRGHQAVFRFYYDYPTMDTGVPQFVIDSGLEMRKYNEPNDLGGGGLCPDYSNQYFRQSMQSFIKAFGAEYDGDKRIGFITMGLLGFWGEWHNWPYDEDTSDKRPDWSIPAAVYDEVYKAYDDAFNITKLCAREPKSGVDVKKYDVGYHDDSFGYATLSKSEGGQEWSFMQKIKNFGLQDAWKTNCIGGEVYPDIQLQIFSETNTNNYQNWDKCLKETHATWVINEKIKEYTETNLNNAKKASKDMGYDLRVDTAYYDNDISNKFYLKLDMENIGVAPFYYDHRTWPVHIGLIKNGAVVKEINTEWDLNRVIQGSTTSFEYSTDNIGLENGTYTVAIKVINPLSNGNILGFANENQQDNGWLHLGTFTRSDYVEPATTQAPTQKPTTQAPTTVAPTQKPTTQAPTTVAPTQKPTTQASTTVAPTQKPTTQVPTTVAPTQKPTTQAPTTTVKPEDQLEVWQDGRYIYCRVKNQPGCVHAQLFVDIDNNSDTGFWFKDEGYELLFEDGKGYMHNGDSDAWDFFAIDIEQPISMTNDYIEMKLDKSFIQYDMTVKVLMKMVNSNWQEMKTIGPAVFNIEAPTAPVETTQLTTKDVTFVPGDNSTVTPKIKKPKVKLAKKKSAKKIQVKVKKQTGIVGYQVKVTKKAKAKRAIYKKLIKKNVAKFTLKSKKFRKYKKLFVSARAYVMNGNKKKYSIWSKPKKVKK